MFGYTFQSLGKHTARHPDVQAGEACSFGTESGAVAQRHARPVDEGVAKAVVTHTHTAEIHPQPESGFWLNGFHTGHVTGYVIQRELSVGRDIVERTIKPILTFSISRYG